MVLVKYTSNVANHRAGFQKDKLELVTFRNSFGKEKNKKGTYISDKLAGIIWQKYLFHENALKSSRWEEGNSRESVDEKCLGYVDPALPPVDLAPVVLLHLYSVALNKIN